MPQWMLSENTDWLSEICSNARHSCNSLDCGIAIFIVVKEPNCSSSSSGKICRKAIEDLKVIV